MSDLPDYTRGVSVTIVPPPAAVVGRPKPYETTVAAAGTPNTHDVKTDLGKNASNGYISCDGPGDLQVEISDDGTNYSDEITVKDGDVLSLEGLDISKIRVDATVNGTAYRILVV